MLNYSRNNNKVSNNHSQSESVAEIAADNLAALAKSFRSSPNQKTETTWAPREFNATIRLGGRCFFVSDFIALILSYLVGHFTSVAYNTYTDAPFIPSLFADSASSQQFIISMILGFMAILWLDTKGHYRQRLPYWESLRHLVTVALVGLVCGGFVQYALKDSFSRLQLGTFWATFGLFMFIGRGLVRHFLDKMGQWKINALVIGTQKTAQGIVQAMSRERQMGYNIISQLSSDSLYHLLKSSAWQQLLSLYDANHVFLALEGSEMENHQKAIRTLVRARVPYSVVPPWRDLPSSSMSQHHFFSHDVMLMTHTCVLEQPLPRFIKRAFDIVASGCALILLSPVLIVVGLLVKLDGGPIFFGHKRIGLNGDSFPCLKFRSMVLHGDEVLKQHLASNPEAQAEWQREMKLRDDPRITRIGKFLRSSSIDELPQLLNVLRGDMSLVGPRPIVVAEVERYRGDIAHYYRVRPGITGLWQVSGRNDVSYSQRVHMDSWYVRNWSLWLDVAVICKTFPVILKRTGAY